MLFKVFSAAELVKSANNYHYDCNDKTSSWIANSWNKTNDGVRKLCAASIACKQNNGWAHDTDGDSSDNATNNNSNTES